MTTRLSLESILVPAAEQVSCSIGEESSILNLKSSVYYGLDPVGARVWTLLRKAWNVAHLRDALVDEYQVEAERCGRDLLDLLENMLAEGLIEVRGVQV